MNIFGLVYSIVKAKNMDVDAEIDFKNKQIIIDEELVGDAYTQRIIHEGFHGVWDRIGIYHSGISPDTEEIICDSFSTFMIDNFDIKLKTTNHE